MKKILFSKLKGLQIILFLCYDCITSTFWLLVINHFQAGWNMDDLTAYKVLTDVWILTRAIFFFYFSLPVILLHAWPKNNNLASKPCGRMTGVICLYDLCNELNRVVVVVVGNARIYQNSNILLKLNKSLPLKTEKIF